jgi:hypothetical protein
MEGNPLLNPVGSLPPQVYWRRRAMAGIVAVLVIWFAWTAFPGKGGGANAAQSPTKSAKSAPSALGGSAAPTTPPVTVTTPAPTVTTIAPATPLVTVTSPAAAVTTPAVPQCTAASLQLKLTADHTVYAAGALPRFVLVVTNVGATSCRVDVGTAARGFVVTSGTDRIWSSSDCTKTSPNVATFKSKDAVSYAHTWDRQRSTSIGCAAAGTQGRPGTYKVVAHVGTMFSNLVVFRLA